MAGRGEFFHPPQKFLAAERRSVFSPLFINLFFHHCLGALAREVVSLELVPELAASARARLDATGLGSNIRIEVADALQYDCGERLFDAVCVTGAVTQVPARFLQWLRPGGRLFVVRGQAPAMEAVRMLKADAVNAAATESLFETGLAYLQGAEPVPQFLF